MGATEESKQNYNHMIYGGIALMLNFSLGCTLTIYNKWLFSTVHFPFPVFISMTHQFPGAIYGAIQILKDPYNSPLVKHWQSFLLVGSFFSSQIVCNNWSLVYLHPSVNVIIKSFAPVLQIFAVLIFEFHRRYSWRVYAVVPVIVSATLIAFTGNPEPFTPDMLIGVALAIGSLVLTVAFMTVTSKVLHDKKVDLIDTWYCNSIGALPLMITMFLAKETSVIHEFSNPSLLLWVCLGAMFAFTYQLTVFALVKYTTAVYTTVVGNVRLACTIFASYMVFPKVMSINEMVGIAGTVLGFLLFNAVLYNEKKMAAAAAKTQEITKDQVSETAPLLQQTTGGGAVRA